MKNYNGRNSFPWIISINICLKLSNLFTVQDVLQQFYELKNTGNVLNDLHLKQHRQIAGTFQQLPHKKVFSEWMSVRSHRAWGQTSLGSFAQTHPCSFPLEGTFSFTGRTGGSRHWKWQRKKRMREKWKWRGKKKSVFSNVLWKKCSFQNDDLFEKVVWKKKVISFNRHCVWQAWLEESPGKVALALGQVQWDFPRVYHSHLQHPRRLSLGFLGASLSSRARSWDLSGLCFQSHGIFNLPSSC